MKNNLIKDTILRISGTNPKKCMACGKCSATCPGGVEMDILPHRFVKYTNDGRFEELSQSKALWACLSCFACIERCPRGVEPSSLIEAVRATTLRKQGASHLKQDDIPAIIESDEEIPQQLVVAALRKFS